MIIFFICRYPVPRHCFVMSICPFIRLLGYAVIMKGLNLLFCVCRKVANTVKIQVIATSNIRRF